MVTWSGVAAHHGAKPALRPPPGLDAVPGLWRGAGRAGQRHRDGPGRRGPSAWPASPARRPWGYASFTPRPCAWPTTEGRVTMLLELTTEDAVWKALPSERRNRVRRGGKLGLTATWGGAEALDEFYPGLRDEHARPGLAGPQPRASSGRCWPPCPTSPASCWCAIAAGAPWARPCACSSVTRSWFRGCPRSARRSPSVRTSFCTGRLSGSAAAKATGRSISDARSATPGTFEFKRQWGAQPHPLPWLFIDAKPGAPPSVDRDASRFDLMVRAWKRLPMPVANALGPWIRRQVPN